MNILFAGTPEFSVAPLKAILAAGHTVCGVLTQPDRPSGRGRKLTASPVKRLAIEAHLPVYQPHSLKETDLLPTLTALNADVMVVVAYGLILPRHILDLPRYGCLNIHASLLPRWRGAAPIQRAIEAGDRETGITIMQMDEGLDTGDMILEKRIPIGNRTDAGQLHDTLALLGAQAIVEALSRLPLSQNQVTPQDSAQATYAAKLSKAEANIDWSESASSIDAKVRALTPWPVAQTHLDNVTYRIWEALPDTTHSKEAAPGTIVESSRDGLRVSTGQGDLWIKRLQIPGGKPLTVEQHLAAHRVAEGSRFAHPTTP